MDLEPEETEIDFSRRPLPPGRKLGTIGLPLPNTDKGDSIAMNQSPQYDTA